MTLIEMLVVITVIGLLAALLMPALNAARESSRKVLCKSNLRQIGMGLQQQAEKNRVFCTGAFDWQRDGSVTDLGWVADLVNAGIPVGKLLCPSNPAQISATYNDLLLMDTAAMDSCANRLGSVPQTNPDGSQIINPCRQIIMNALAPMSDARLRVVQDNVYQKHFNTNYTASWWLVRSGVNLDVSGNLQSLLPGCAASLTSRGSTYGPLTQGRADASTCSSSFVPLMGCGGSAGTLIQTIGTIPSGSPMVVSFTAGPVTNPGMQPLPGFAAGTPREGAAGWWAVWNATIQDYRNFSPVHRGSCNVLMADGSVQSFSDNNRDGLLNNGFTATSQNGFVDDTIELSPDEVFSRWSLR